MNILHKQVFDKDLDLYLNIYNDTWVLQIKSYKFTLNDFHVDYPYVDNEIYNMHKKDIDLLYNLRIS